MEEELLLQQIVASIRRRGTDMTAKQVHAEVVLDLTLAATTLSAVKRACSKVGKAAGKDVSRDPERPMQEKKGRYGARQPLGRFREDRPVAVDAKQKAQVQPMSAGAAGEHPADFLKRSLAQHIEHLVALQPHPKEGAVTTDVEVHPAVSAILLDELDLSAASCTAMLSPRQLLALLPTLSTTVHPVAVGEWSEVIVLRGAVPDIYVWAGFMSIKVILPSSGRNLVLRVVTRVVGGGDPNKCAGTMHMEGEREFDGYLNCETLHEFVAWRDAKKTEQFKRMFEQVSLGRM